MPMYYAIRQTLARVTSITGGTNALPADAVDRLNTPLRVLGDATTVEVAPVTLLGEYTIAWDLDEELLPGVTDWRPAPLVIVRPIAYAIVAPPSAARPFWHDPWGDRSSPQDRARIARLQWREFFTHEMSGLNTILRVPRAIRVVRLVGQPRGDYGQFFFGGRENAYTEARAFYAPDDW